MVLKSPKKRFSEDELAKNSLCEFIRETRIVKQPDLDTNQSSDDPADQALEAASKSSECSDGYCMVDVPRM